MKSKKTIYIIIGVVAVIIIGFGIFAFSKVAGIERQLMELEIQEEALETQYRTGSITFEQYSSQKLEIETKEQQLEFQKDLFELDF